MNNQNMDAFCFHKNYNHTYKSEEVSKTNYKYIVTQ